MPAAKSPASAAPRRRAAPSKPSAKPAATAAPAAAPAKLLAKPPKKLPPAAVEATAAAFMAGFSALPAAVQWRVVQLIEAREDEADARELQAIQEARLAGTYPDDAVPWEQAKAELATRDHAHAHQSTDLPQAQAA